MKSGSDWLPETRASILDADALPSETTWVWDPIVDRLVAIFESGKSGGTAPAPDAGLVRQYVHGDQAYDDPIEVDTATGRYLPLTDEAATGSLQAVVNGRSGKMSERVLYADAYGDAPRYITGPIVDRIEIDLHKSGTGGVDQAKVRVHVTESVDAATLSSGVRLASLNGSGSVVATSSITPSHTDASTIEWTLGSTDWTALQSATGAVQIEIAVSNTLRAILWDGAVMPMPAWLLDGADRASTAQFPVIQRKSFAAIAAFAATIDPTKSDTDQLYAIKNLYLAATATSVTKTMTGFKSAPFVDPRSGYGYFRASVLCHSDAVLSRRLRARATLLRMSSTLAVQVKVAGKLL